MLSSRFALVLVAVLSLAACGELREDLGLGRNAPDEFAVVDRAPLSMPPDYGLRPPRPGAARPQNIETDQQASALLFNRATPKALDAQASASEKNLLAATNAAAANPNIREVVDRESAQKVVASPHLIEKLTNWDGSNQKPATTVDAPAEAERIKKAQEEKKPINSGATPVIEKKSSGWLGL